MARMLCIINDTGHQRRTAVEIFKIDDDFLDNFRVMMHLAKFRLGFEQALEETIEMSIKGATSSEATIETIPETTGQTMGLGFRDPLYPLRI
jgi:hypothetical protein